MKKAISRKKAVSTRHSAHGKPGFATASHKKPKARRRERGRDDGDRVTTFPEVNGKVVREVRFSHHDPNSFLAIAFKDRTVLYFEVDPEPLVLPVDIRAHLHRRAPERGQDLGRA